MELHKLRVIDEYAELIAKSNKLQEFLYSSKPYKTLIEEIGVDEHTRMERQLTAMGTYRDALRERIKEF